MIEEEMGFWATTRGIAVVVIGCIVSIAGITWLGFYIHAMQIADTKYLGTAEENANREVVEQSKTYRDGVRRDLDELSLSYAQAKSPDEKAAIVSVMRHRVEGVPPELVPANVKVLVGL